MNQGNQILTEQLGSLGVITLNRPEALNALSLEMIRQIAVTLKQWESDDGVKAVLFLGAGDRAFCAGGDIKSFYSSGMDYRRGHVDLKVPALFFGEEYSLNRQIFHYPKPTISVMDGITMGGGYGVAGNCKHRLATSNTVFAMPEVSIGFFPDVGSVYHLNRSPNHFGRYLGLTDAHIGAGDVIAAELADGYINAQDIDALVDLLAEGDVEHALGAHICQSPAAEVFEDHKDTILQVFGSLDVLTICASLRSHESDWAKDVLEQILSRSPTSVLVTATYLSQVEGADFDEVIAMDYQLAQHFINYHDMYEGIRAALIDKDKKPVWNPATLDTVKPEEIARYFQAGRYSFDDVRIFA